MIKKLIIVLAVLIIASIVFMPEITAVMARTAIKPEYKEKSWAPGMAYSSATINLRFFRFNTAAKILERSMETWPDAEWQGDAHYKIALAQEKIGNGKEAIDLYNAFLAEYPDHVWREQAEKRIVNIQANML